MLTGINCFGRRFQSVVFWVIDLHCQQLKILSPCQDFIPGLCKESCTIHGGVDLAGGDRYLLDSK